MGLGGEGWGPAFLFVSLYKNLHPDPVSGNRGRHLSGYGRLPRSRAGRRRAQACGARRSRAGIGARPPLWVTHTHQAGRRRWRVAARGN